MVRVRVIRIHVSNSNPNTRGQGSVSGSELVLRLWDGLCFLGLKFGVAVVLKLQPWYELGIKVG
jgi:hypothetical protein